MIYELRQYKVAEGRMDELHDRFKKHTLRLFEKYGIKPIAFWNSANDEDINYLTYLLQFEDLEFQKKAWTMFMEDEERIQIWNKSNEKGKLVIEIVSKTLKSTEYSPLH